MACNGNMPAIAKALLASSDASWTRLKKRTLDFKVTDATSYDEHVGDFERFTTVLTAPLAARMIAMAGISAGQRVLDIGTGTGVVASKPPGLPASEAVVSASIYREKMLASARANAQQRPGERIEFKAMGRRGTAI